MLARRGVSVLQNYLVWQFCDSAGSSALATDPTAERARGGAIVGSGCVELLLFPSPELKVSREAACRRRVKTGSACDGRRDLRRRVPGGDTRPTGTSRRRRRSGAEGRPSCG